MPDKYYCVLCALLKGELVDSGLTMDGMPPYFSFDCKNGHTGWWDHEKDFYKTLIDTRNNVANVLELLKDAK